MTQNHPKGRLDHKLWDHIPAHLGVVNATFPLQGQFVCSYVLESNLFHDLQETKLSQTPSVDSLVQVCLFFQTKQLLCLLLGEKLR